ncbi:HNH endonuclease signature motif containing protein [Stenotrophomonas maltophilia]|uniref:HNH endonuclease signature motif containing protein n=1 Tax=Stenotrophomonas maltophilia TaxID=40324 RepID=UPI002E78C430|nr:HNH endonuclease signature motif containing protein [Stenotrophomonas maltophilia]
MTTPWTGCRRWQASSAPQHRAAGWRPYKETTAQVRKRQARRALPTNCSLWRRLRAVVLAREPLCRCCAGQGRVRPATEVDHIDGDDSNNADSNLQPLCRPCHSAKTARENGGFGILASMVLMRRTCAASAATRAFSSSYARPEVNWSGSEPVYSPRICTASVLRWAASAASAEIRASVSA